MTLLNIAPPEQCGLDGARWNTALEIARNWCERDDRAPAAAVMVARKGLTPGPQFFGRQRLASNSPKLRDDAIFLVASITKPIVCMGAMLLLERGQLALNDRVTDYIPEFGRNGKYATTIRHLLTHTSGLPDMLPNNTELRKTHSPLSAFVAGTCDVTPDFPPGRAVQYQSKGIAVLAAIMEKITGQSCDEFLRREFFEPLGMKDSRLGAPDEWFIVSSPTVDRIAEIRVPAELADATDWNWNSRYWRQLGAAWGGLLTTPMDLGQFAQLMLNRGRAGNRQLLSLASVEASTRNQLAVMKDVPDEDRHFKSWGFGWRLQWSNHANTFGDLVSPTTFGHWGATGTLLWIDPQRDSFAMILTSQPLDPNGAPFQRLSNAIAAAFV
ncbi:MAG: serine hydrolase [Planctomycetia bacterium]|nr:serine hydrolase [Planctomycetia bacterium]